MLLLQGALSKEWKSTLQSEIPFSFSALGGAIETKRRRSRSDTVKKRDKY